MERKIRKSFETRLSLVARRPTTTTTLAATTRSRRQRRPNQELGLLFDPSTAMALE